MNICKHTDLFIHIIRQKKRYAKKLSVYTLNDGIKNACLREKYFPIIPFRQCIFIVYVHKIIHPHYASACHKFGLYRYTNVVPLEYINNILKVQQNLSYVWWPIASLLYMLIIPKELGVYMLRIKKKKQVEDGWMVIKR